MDKGQLKFCAGNTAAVIRDADQSLAAVPYVNLHFCRAGVQRVFHQFLDDRRRALDDLAGRDLGG